MASKLYGVNATIIIFVFVLYLVIFVGGGLNALFVIAHSLQTVSKALQDVDHSCFCCCCSG